MASELGARGVEMLRLRVVEKLTLAEIGERYALSGERVRQILNKCASCKNRDKMPGQPLI